MDPVVSDWAAKRLSSPVAGSWKTHHDHFLRNDLAELFCEGNGQASFDRIKGRRQEQALLIRASRQPGIGDHGLAAQGAEMGKAETQGHFRAFGAGWRARAVIKVVKQFLEGVG